MPKRIEADAIILASHDGKCELRLEAGAHRVGIFLSGGDETRFVVAHSDGTFAVEPSLAVAPSPPEIESIGFAPLRTQAMRDDAMIGESDEFRDYISKAYAKVVEEYSVPRPASPLDESNSPYIAL